MNAKSIKKLLFSLLFILWSIVCFALTGCTRKIDYFSYVSEFRNNIFLAETENFTLRIYSVTKETPYVADGIAHESTARTEVFLLAPEGTQNYTLTVYFNGKEVYQTKKDLVFQRGITPVSVTMNKGTNTLLMKWTHTKKQKRLRLRIADYEDTPLYFKGADEDWINPAAKKIIRNPIIQDSGSTMTSSDVKSGNKHIR